MRRQFTKYPSNYIKSSDSYSGNITDFIGQDIWVKVTIHGNRPDYINPISVDGEYLCFRSIDAEYIDTNESLDADYMDYLLYKTYSCLIELITLVEPIESIPTNEVIITLRDNLLNEDYDTEFYHGEDDEY